MSPARNQFSAEDERIGHQRMIDAIRAEQVKDEPEPDHDPWSEEVCAFGNPEPIRVIHCCDWHRYHEKGNQ